MSPTTPLAAAADGGPGWAAGVVAETAVPNPSDEPLREDLEPTDVSPGLPGFLAIFAVALACIGLFFGLTRQLRRMRRNAEARGLGPDGADGAGRPAGDGGPAGPAGPGREDADPSAGGPSAGGGDRGPRAV